MNEYNSLNSITLTQLLLRCRSHFSIDIEPRMYQTVQKASILA